ncbi:hypothetical protein VOLCADRAFT_108573 [Volvox carteri f. nagariensis]|uniref:Peptidase S1 domain-containing protein n=1 Tax=Volvox carteri f. nagariensis TaxID=3068 RepID=D8UL19_VOLCA|nr:uncharacterized protein VOLCADRAFT_108573 [Volvox carteri f. nagariensis]EFJ39581.1 hypothetical protein VOLCADRAFT_108573 [Volvox carteri f. nagariensis]|eukprot:XP_002959353.1 hypothetical protein VOLCADRAFT_108573 [Volvox carteri f. nagariensis]
MPTIHEALAAVRGETEATVAPILQALQAEGFDVDAEAGDAFCLLDVNYLRSHLNLRQLTALKAAIKSADAGTSNTAADAAGGTDMTATIRARACYSSKYAAHLVVEPPNSPPYKEAATVVGPHHVATFAHGRHENWTLGQQMQIAVHCPDADRRVLVDSTVVCIKPIQDVAILEVQRKLVPPVLDFGVSAGDKYYVHGQSTQAQADATSISHGMVVVTEPDVHSHIRGDIVAGVGDSGGGCFSVDTGKLVAMVVGSDTRTNKAILVPTAVICSILSDLSATSGAAGAAT